MSLLCKLINVYGSHVLHIKAMYFTGYVSFGALASRLLFAVFSYLLVK